jgi:glycosyltransferase involved in cell wall biosynthesis
MNRKMRVMVLVSSHNIGGVETKLHYLAQFLDREKFQLTFLLIYPYYKAGEDSFRIRKKHNAFFQWKDVETIELPMKHRYDVFLFFKVARIIREMRIDLLYMMALGVGTFLGPIAAKLGGVCRIVRENQNVIRGLYPGILKFLDRVFISMTDRIVVPSLFLKNLMVEELRIVPSKITVIPNAIDLTSFGAKPGRKAVKKELGIREQTRVVGVVANLLPVKAHDVLIRAVPEVIKVIPDTVFLLAGDGPLRSNLESLVQKLNLTEHVQFLGHRSDVAELVQSFDVGVLCSKIETQGIVLIEMMATGVPVIAPDVGGIPEIIEDGVNGLLTVQGDSDQLAGSVICLLSDPKRAHLLGKAGRDRVQEKFSVDCMVRSTEQIFKSCYETMP